MGDANRVETHLNQIRTSGATQKARIPYFSIGCVSIPIGLSLLLAVIGLSLGTDKIDSPGMIWVNGGLMFHLPTILVTFIIFPGLPMGAGEDGSFEVSLLFFCMIPSAALYLAVGWFIDTCRLKYEQTIDRKREASS